MDELGSAPARMAAIEKQYTSYKEQYESLKSNIPIGDRCYGDPTRERAHKFNWLWEVARHETSATHGQCVYCGEVHPLNRHGYGAAQ